MSTLLDSLARRVAQATSRRDALRALGTVAATSALAPLSFAVPRARRPAGPEPGTCSGSPVPGLPEFCSTNGTCICFATTEGDRACLELSLDLCYDTATCASTADCAPLGPSYVCAAVGTDYCDDGLGRCLQPCGTTDWSGTWQGATTLGGESLGVRFVLTDVGDSLTGRAFVADPLTGVFMDAGPIAYGSHHQNWSVWTTATGLRIAGEFEGASFVGTATFPTVRGHPEFVADVALVRTGGTPSEPAPAVGGAAPVAVLAPHPNPARAGAMITIPVEVSQPSALRVAVTDALGREVAVLYDGPAPVGVLRLAVGASLAAGIYVVRATSGTAAVSRTLTVVR